MCTSTSRRCKEDTLDKRIDALTSEFAQIKSLILNLQTGEAPAPVMENPTRESPISEEDAMSVRASHGQFCEIHSQFSHDDSQNTAHRSVEGLESDQDVVRQAFHIALTRLILDTAPKVAAPTCAFFRRTMILSSLRSKSLTHRTSPSRALVAMQNLMPWVRYLKLMHLFPLSFTHQKRLGDLMLSAHSLSAESQMIFLFGHTIQQQA